MVVSEGDCRKSRSAYSRRARGDEPHHRGAQAVVRDVRHRIVNALHQDADVDARHIEVTVSDNTATLTGTVGTWLQRDSAERAAASAPGIAHVDNRIMVQSFHDSKIDDWDEMC